MNLSSILVACVAVVVSTGCSKSSPDAQKKQDEAVAAALTSAMVPSSTSPGGGATEVLATCVDNAASTCREYLGLVPTMAEEFCKRGDTGKFTRGATPCTRSGVVGTCTSKGEEASEISYRYKAKDETPSGAAANAQAACEMLSGVWAATPLATAAPLATATAAKPAAGTTKPKKK